MHHATYNLYSPKTMIGLMGSHPLDELDEPSAALRILHRLYGNEEGLSVTQLYGLMKRDYGVGRTAVDSSRKALVHAGLAEEYDAKWGRYSYRVLVLTGLGVEVAGKVCEISEHIKHVKSVSTQRP